MRVDRSRLNGNVRFGHQRQEPQLRLSLAWERTRLLRRARLFLLYFNLITPPFFFLLSSLYFSLSLNKKIYSSNFYPSALLIGRSFNSPSPRFFPYPPCKSSFLFFLLPVFLSYTYSPLCLALRPTTQPPPSNLKERIAALQQCSDPLSPATRPTSPPPRDASLTPPRGSLRDKIAKFERKGGVPIPRSSFGLASAPPEETGSTKSRELYGNRVAALGKGRPTAPGNSAHRAVSFPTAPLASPRESPASRTSPDDNAAKSAARLTPNSIGNSVSSSIKSPSRCNSSGFTDTHRPPGPRDVPGGSDESQEPSEQPATDAQPDNLSATQDAKASEPIAKPTVSTSRRPLSVSSSPLSTGFVVTNINRSDVSSNPLRSTASEATPTQTASFSTPAIHESPPPPAESHTQEHTPVVTPKSVVSTVQAHISVEQVPVKDTNSLGVRPDRPPQNGSLEISS